MRVVLGMQAVQLYRVQRQSWNSFYEKLEVIDHRHRMNGKKIFRRAIHLFISAAVVEFNRGCIHDG